MRNSVTHAIELLIGAILIGLGLLYLMSQYRVLSRLSDVITQDIIEDSNVFQQHSNIYIQKISHEEIYAVIMGYRDYPIMIDKNVVPQNELDYELYFSYIKDGYYQKEYSYDENRNLIIIKFSYIGM